MAWRGADPQGGQASTPEMLVEPSLSRAGGIPPLRAHMCDTHFWGQKPRDAGEPPCLELPLGKQQPGACTHSHLESLRTVQAGK